MFIALGIGYYLLNGVHPYTRSDNPIRLSDTNSNLTNPTDILNENLQASLTTDSHERTLPINT